MKAGALACLLMCVHSRSFAADLLIRNITIINVSTATSVSRSILIHKGQIAAVAAEIHASPQTRIIDGTGKFVIPGLWDMHVHLTSRDQLPLYSAWGVTSVRDMGSDYDRVNVWRAEMQKGELLGPHIETCGPALDGVPSSDPKMPVRVVRTPSEARTVFDQLDGEGVDFIGILPHLPRDAYFALLERARKYYSTVAGDVPESVSALEAVEARQQSIDHVSRILDAANPDELFQRMALFETRFVPALAELRGGGSAGTLLKMQRAGVAIMAGTDDGKPGESLHEELELLVAAGLSPAQALRTATLEPARYLNAESLGAVEQGRNADLVILDADPLADIRNTRKIAAVVVGGKYMSRAGLNAIRDRAARAVPRVPLLTRGATGRASAFRSLACVRGSEGVSRLYRAATARERKERTVCLHLFANLLHLT